MARSKKEYISLFAKGLAMGAADVVPGVSGGTIALISGIYEEFINSLKSISSVLPILKNKGLKAAWQHVNAEFLLVLFSGIAVSLLTLVQFIKYALTEHPILLWSFFFGLIVSSTYYVAKRVNQWSIINIIAFIAGTVLIYYLTSISPSESSIDPWFIFISGALAICAMILPGISGAFILVLLGKYAFIIESLSDLKVKTIAFFSAGCLVGLLSFSHFLSWMLRKYHDLTIAILSGFMLGSLNKIWPWKETLEWGMDRHEEKIAVLEKNVLPNSFEGEPFIIGAAFLGFVGFALIILFESAANKKP